MPTLDIEKGEGGSTVAGARASAPALSKLGDGAGKQQNWGPAVDHTTHSCLEQKPQGASRMQQVGEARHARATAGQCRVGSASSASANRCCRVPSCRRVISRLLLSIAATAARQTASHTPVWIDALLEPQENATGRFGLGQ